MYLKVICAWCSKFIGTKDAGQGDKQLSPISHGICPECAEKVREEMNMTLSPNLKPLNIN